MTAGTPKRRDAVNEGAVPRPGRRNGPGVYPGDPPTALTASEAADDALEADLRRVVAAVDPAPAVAVDLSTYDVGTYDEHRYCGGDPHAWADRIHRWLRAPDSPPGWVYYRCRDCGAVEEISADEIEALEDW